MLHADHTYLDHPMPGLLADNAGRGAGVELRLHGCDPDRAEAAARRLGFTVLAPAADKPHGLREAYLLDEDGYVWVADVQKKQGYLYPFPVPQNTLECGRWRWRAMAMLGWH